MRLAIADPPYLGRAALWYGGKGRSKQGTAGRAVGRGDLAPEFHTDAHEWDDPVKHIELMVALEEEFDGWAVACSGKTLAPSRWVWTCGHGHYWQSGALLCARRLLEALEGLGEPAAMDSGGWVEEWPDR